MLFVPNNVEKTQSGSTAIQRARTWAGELSPEIVLISCFSNSLITVKMILLACASFSITEVDKEVKEKFHAPTIGILLCETKNEVVAQYSLDKIDSPIGISQYELGEALTQHLKMIHKENQSLIN